jgi:hypothetical protein
VNRFIMSSMRHKVGSALQFIGGGISRAATSAIFVGFILVIAGILDRSSLTFWRSRRHF